MAHSAGDVVLVPFPYRDQLAESTRPAVILSAEAYNQHGDVVIAAITSHPPRISSDYALLDWAVAGLQFASTVRMLLATVADRRIVLRIGRLSDRDWAAVQDRVLQLFAWP
ncbi:MAG: type II toxin-antitoxin system PemK/MazF family toxin [Gemmataceae bacterium]|nr:type II toxin-antitoxin system PemK/MazF family toxin [Gemmataceae bacterium]